MKDFARAATIKLVFRILLSVLAFDFLYLILTFFEEFVIELNNVGPLLLSYSTLYHIGLIFLQIIVIIYIFIKWYFVFYVVGDTHITKRTGIFVKRDKVVNYSNVRVVDYRQGVLGRIFHYGDIVFELVGSGNDFIIRGIERPDEIVDVVKKSIRVKE